ncbi:MULTISPECIES: cysteine synthase A [Cetobacterium]|uniref:Cysteine synthase A n=1 Tax=Candidatus Cetobacterium colombiensis TaxID=3073100 RepID=A0ABU4WAP9_9FUSO|nr:cysteine synthase A [Candidatus Cetobacterium colombiensis]MDX8336614.1 cysteine synthase A [Candidatus Cetobacterium colombiensis]
MIYENILDLIGNTPILKLKNLGDKECADLYVKLEKYNLTGSVKDRAALNMIEEAEKNGLLKPGSIIVEPTSGNTGIALAAIGKIKGYKVIIIMPETMSEERRKIIKTYGAELILTEGSKGMKGAISKALELAENDERYFIPQQFENVCNPQKHYETTAVEILKDIPDLDAFVAGVGTGGTITGVGKKLKEEKNNIKIYAVEPYESQVISGGNPGPHKIQGIGAGFIPEIYNFNFVDEVITVSSEEAFEMVRLILEKEGIFLGISSGASIFAALKVAQKLGKGKKVLALSPDGGEKYMSMDIIK